MGRKVKTIITDMDQIKVDRLEVPYNLTRKQYIELRMDYMTTIVSAKKELKKAFDIYKEELSKVLSIRRKLVNAEDRLVETFDRLESPKLK